MSGRRGPFLFGAIVVVGALSACTVGNQAAQPSTSGSPVVRTTDSPTGAVAPSCTNRQLAGQFLGGGYGTGNDFGVILIRNVSPSPCTLQGPVGFYGLDVAGQRIAGTGMNRPFTMRPAVLPPGIRPGVDGVAPATGAYLEVFLLGAERDDPTAANALCSGENEVTPASLVVSIGEVSISAANRDPTAFQVKAIYGCHGRILAESAELSAP